MWRGPAAPRAQLARDAACQRRQMRHPAAGSERKDRHRAAKELLAMSSVQLGISRAARLVVLAQRGGRSNYRRAE